MTKLDPGDFLRAHEIQHEVESLRGVFFSESTGARTGSVHSGTRLQFCNQYSREKLHLTRMNDRSFWRSRNERKTVATWWLVFWCLVLAWK